MTGDTDGYVLMPEALSRAVRWLCRLADQRFYGRVELHFEAGRLERLVKIESLRPAELGDAAGNAGPEKAKA